MEIISRVHFNLTVPEATRAMTGAGNRGARDAGYSGLMRNDRHWLAAPGSARRFAAGLPVVLSRLGFRSSCWEPFHGRDAGAPARNPSAHVSRLTEPTG